jgi:uncharacterized protein YecE (DUF72 family)
VTATVPSVTGLYVGASGFSYPSWRPGFYPAGLQPSEFLRFYAERLRTVELNTTGYRLPAEELFDRWASQTPPGFRFAVKMPPRGLRELATFEERVGRLGDRLGPIRIVVQSARDDGLLELVLGSIDPALQYAFDLRHDSWAGVEGRLAEAGAVRVNDLDAGAPFRYLRLREPPYDEAALAERAAQIRPLLAAGLDVYVYFRHEDEPTAPAYAERLLTLLAD